MLKSKPVNHRAIELPGMAMLPQNALAYPKTWKTEQPETASFYKMLTEPIL
jgi:hypothetical protein